MCVFLCQVSLLRNLVHSSAVWFYDVWNMTSLKSIYMYIVSGIVGSWGVLSKRDIQGTLSLCTTHPFFPHVPTYVCLALYSTLYKCPLCYHGPPYDYLCLSFFMSIWLYGSALPQKGHGGISSLRGMKIVILQQPPTRANKWNSFTLWYFNVFNHTRTRVSSSA